jgi:hypothetical protein
MSEITIGVSVCLLGKQVCHDGGQRRNGDSRQEALFTGVWVLSILALCAFYAALRRQSR